MRRWSHLTPHIVCWPLEGHPRSLTLDDWLASFMPVMTVFFRGGGVKTEDMTAFLHRYVYSTSWLHPMSIGVPEDFLQSAPDDFADECDVASFRYFTRRHGYNSKLFDLIHLSFRKFWFRLNSWLTKAFKNWFRSTHDSHFNHINFTSLVIVALRLHLYDCRDICSGSHVHMDIFFLLS